MVSQALLLCSPPLGRQGVPHCPIGSCITGYVLSTQKLLPGLSLQDQLNGQSAELVHTWWQAGPEPSSMHSFPAAQPGEPHAEPLLLEEQPDGAANTKASTVAAAKTRARATTRWRNAMGSAMDDETGGRYAALGERPRAWRTHHES